MLKLSELALRNPGKPVRWFAAELGLTIPRTHRLLQIMRDSWRATWVARKEALIADELQRISLVEQQAWEAWEKSKQTKSVVTKEQAQKAGWDGIARVKVTTEEPAGDPRFLEMALRAGAERRKLLGLDAPLRVEAKVQVEQERAAMAEELVADIVEALGPENSEAIARIAKVLPKKWAEQDRLLAGEAQPLEVIEARVSEAQEDPQS